MTVIVEQAARVACPNGPDHDHQPNLDQGCNWALQLCQALADAGLLAEPARTVPTRVEITDVQDLEMSLDRVVIRDADGDIYERQGELETERGTFAAWLGTHTGVKPSIDIPLPATVIYVPGEFTGERPTRQEVWQEAFSAGYMDGQSHTVPTRGEIADAVMERDEIDVDYLDRDSALKYADAVLALLADQPTVAEVKAQAWEEGAQAAWLRTGDGWNGEYAEGTHDGSRSFRDCNPDTTNPYRTQEEK